MSGEREKRIVKTSILGIGANAALSAMKAVVGTATGSIAITMDAVNNLTDALSSVITILGAKLSSKRPDREHPYGYGRMEHLSALAIAVVILYAGITALAESAEKILEPVVPDYTTVSLALVAAAVVAKVLLGMHFRRVGNEVSSKPLIASGTDALMDSLVSASTLLAALVFIWTGLSLEAWLGAVIAVLVIRTGLEALKDTVSDILGRRIPPEESRAIKETVSSFDGVLGAYDLVLHSYGPDVTVGSIHIEVPETMTAKEIDRLERRIFERVMQENGVLLTGIGVYAAGEDEETRSVQDDVRAIAAGFPDVLQTHGLFVDRESKEISVDAVVSYSCEDREGLAERIRSEIAARHPGYEVRVQLDADASDRRRVNVISPADNPVAWP